MSLGDTYVRFKSLATVEHCGVTFHVTRWRGYRREHNYFALLLDNVEVANGIVTGGNPETPEQYARECKEKMERLWSPYTFEHDVYATRAEYIARRRGMRQ